MRLGCARMVRVRGVFVSCTTACTLALSEFPENYLLAIADKSLSSRGNESKEEEKGKKSSGASHPLPVTYSNFMSKLHAGCSLYCVFSFCSVMRFFLAPRME